MFVNQNRVLLVVIAAAVACLVNMPELKLKDPMMKGGVFGVCLYLAYAFLNSQGLVEGHEDEDGEDGEDPVGGVVDLVAEGACDPGRRNSTFDTEGIVPSGTGSEIGSGMYADVHIDSRGCPTVNVKEPGSGYRVGDTITLEARDIGGTYDLVLRVSSVMEDY